MDPQRVILVYTASSVRNLDKCEINKLRGVDQRIGRLDIAARIVQAALCTTSDAVAVTIFSAPMCGYITISPEEREWVCASREHEIVKAIVAKLCNEIVHRSFSETIREFKSLGYTTVLLSERGSNFVIRPHKVLYILGAEQDPPIDEISVLVDSIESIGPLSYLASHVVAFINFMYAMRKACGGPIPAWTGCGAFRTPQPRPTRPA